jgi:hypothetical protein
MIANSLRIILLGLIATGLYGAASVSYDTVTGAAPCPHIANIPVCFIVLAGYTLMLIAVIIQSVSNAQKTAPTSTPKKIFLGGWLPVFLLAVIGSLFELSNGNTCPKSDTGLPLCYVSLFFSTVLMITFYGLIRLSNINLSHKTSSPTDSKM